MAAVSNEEGDLLGQVNTIQNANTKTLTGSISFDKLYTILGLNAKKLPFNQAFDRTVSANIPKTKEKDKKIKKSTFRKGATYLVDLLSSIKRVKFN